MNKQKEQIQYQPYLALLGIDVWRLQKPVAKSVAIKKAQPIPEYLTQNKALKPTREKTPELPPNLPAPQPNLEEQPNIQLLLLSMANVLWLLDEQDIQNSGQNFIREVQSAILFPAQNNNEICEISFVWPQFKNARIKQGEAQAVEALSALLEKEVQTRRLLLCCGNIAKTWLDKCTLENKVQALFTPDFNQLIQDAEAKQQLWRQLQSASRLARKTIDKS